MGSVVQPFACFTFHYELASHGDARGRGGLAGVTRHRINRIRLPAEIGERNEQALAGPPVGLAGLSQRRCRNAFGASPSQRLTLGLKPTFRAIRPDPSQPRASINGRRTSLVRTKPAFGAGIHARRVTQIPPGAREETFRATGEIRDFFSVRGPRLCAQAWPSPGFRGGRRLAARVRRGGDVRQAPRPRTPAPPRLQTGTAITARRGAGLYRGWSGRRRWGRGRRRGRTAS